MPLDCFVFRLGGVDVILGIAWLEKLGDMQENCAKLTMDFNFGDKQVRLVGDPSLSRLPISLSSLDKLEDVDYCCWLWEISALPTTNYNACDISAQQHFQLSELLQRHHQIFGDPHGLPPVRANDHQIIL